MHGDTGGRSASYHSDSILMEWILSRSNAFRGHTRVTHRYPRVEHKLVSLDSISPNGSSTLIFSIISKNLNFMCMTEANTQMNTLIITILS